MIKQKISTKLSMTYAVLTILFIGIAAVIFYKYNQYNIHQDGVSNIGQIAENVMAQADSRLTTMDQTAIDVLSDNHFLDLWDQAVVSSGDEVGKEIRKLLTKAYINKSDIRRVSIYGKDGTFYSTGKTDVKKDDVRERIQMIESQYPMKQMNSRVYLKPHLDYWNKSSEVLVVSEIKPVKDRNTDIIGYLEVQQNAFYMDNICNVKWNGKGLKVMVFMEETDELFYTNLPDSKRNDTYIQQVKDFTRQYSKIKEDSHSLFSTASSNYYACKTVIILDKNVLNESLNKMLGGIIAITLVLIIVTTFYSFWTTRMIMRPINLLVKTMQNTDLTNFRQKREIKVKDKETEILVNSFEDMAKRLEDALVKQKKLENVQTKTLFSALQSEMGPHFLYNSLGSIANLCERGETETAADACYSLTEILRYASNYETSEVTIGEEIENLKAYMSIMKSRYQKRIEFEMQIDDDTKYIIIPKLTYQPLVENAIKYSLMEHEKVIIKIYTVVLGDKLVVEIKDNGCGISKEAGEVIRERIDEFHNTDKATYIAEQIQFGGMGLSGTLIRLSIYYGDSFWYELQDNNDEGGTSILFGMNISKYR
ncbi:sensor histidine kinase [Robinsoniella peoriensis]|uniref:sensor histidine kinase n=1 Tax=Robinsoniella peoriensis TaxID=180332 RepID=UPI0005C7B612|nr:histidine kinase [Robinsoniella peoriensis]